MKFFLLLLVGAVGLLSASAQDLPRVIETVSPAVFKITTYDASGNELALGTGFFIDSNGTALTNYHVLKGAAEVSIKTNNYKTYLVNNVISWSSERDLVKFTVKNELNETFPYLKLSDAKAKAGEQIFLIGNPLGLDMSVSDGIVSCVREDDLYGETIQVTAPISQGNSGSPLMNMQGEVYGVVTYFLQSGQNLNFAVSIRNPNAMQLVNHLTFPPSDSNGSSKGNAASVPPANDTDASDGRYYSGSDVKFCSALDADQQPDEPIRTMYAGDGGELYVFVSNAKPLATSELLVDVFRRKGNSYCEFVETKRLNVVPTWYDTHFRCNFYKAGDYRVSVYNADEKWINTGYVTVKRVR